jgi:hypothetical protein
MRHAFFYFFHDVEMLKSMGGFEVAAPSFPNEKSLERVKEDVVHLHGE